MRKNNQNKTTFQQFKPMEMLGGVLGIVNYTKYLELRNRSYYLAEKNTSTLLFWDSRTPSAVRTFSLFSP